MHLTAEEADWGGSQSNPSLIKILFSWETLKEKFLILDIVFTQNIRSPYSLRLHIPYLSYEEYLLSL